MSKILAFSGKKQSGKNTAVNYILGCHMMSLGIIQQMFKINDFGQLRITDIFGDTEFDGIFDINRHHEDVEAQEHLDRFRNDVLGPYIKIYNFADLLKDEVCIKILGLTHEQCYGTDEQKNELTHLMWENMPGVLTPDKCSFMFMETSMGTNTIDDIEPKISDKDFTNENFDSLHWNGFLIHKPGPMSARKVMQYVGTDIFRKMYDDVWVNATMKIIEQEDTLLAIVTDCRFPNEAQAIQNVKGKVVRLTRSPFKDKDLHQSELALDDYDKFDAIIDNKTMSIEQQCKAVYETLYPWSYVPEIKQ